MDGVMIIAALLPAVILMIYIYKKDKVDKEPLALLLGLFLLGAVGTLLASFLETYLCMFASAVVNETTFAYIFIENFLIVALIEECVKYKAVKLLAWRNKAFNYRFDAVIYCVFSSLGFAALENFFYIESEGLSIAFSRGILSVPLHAFCGVFMGVYMGHAKAYEAVGNETKKRRSLKCSVLVPVILHGFYDFCLSFDSTLLTLVFIGFVTVLYLVSICVIKKAAHEDCPVCANWNQPFNDAVNFRDWEQF